MNERTAQGEAHAEPMTPAQFTEEMTKILQETPAWDNEALHAKADVLLVECLRSLGYGAGCDLWDQMEKWYS